jgi:AcrR family transcriptional regulator
MRNTSTSTRRGKGQNGDRAGPRRDILTSEVLDKAAVLFTERGYAGTSLQDIADQVGVSRTAIYHYFDSKEAVLNELVSGVTRGAARIFDELGTSTSLGPAEKLHEAARRFTLWVLDPKTYFKMIDRSEHELPAAVASSHRQTKRRVLSGVSSLIDAGIASGEFRAVDSKVAAFAIIGMCNWTAWWFNDRGEKSAKDVACALADLAIASLRHANEKALPTDLLSLTKSIRTELDKIDRLHGKPK